MSDHGHMTVHDPQWPTIRNGAHSVASDRLQFRYDGIKNGVEGFRDQADTLIKETFTKPPGKLGLAGALFEIISTCVTFVLPEEALMAKLIVEAVKSGYEELKPSLEMYDKRNEEITANTLEATISYCTELTKTTAQEASRTALDAKGKALEAINSALDQYITDNPITLDETDDSYKKLCEALGITHQTAQAVEDELFNKIYGPFKTKIFTISAQRHFFHDLDTDAERFRFLILVVAEQDGTDPDKFLDLIGAERGDYEHYIEIYRSEGAEAAISAFMRGLEGQGSEAR